MLFESNCNSNCMRADILRLIRETGRKILFTCKLSNSDRYILLFCLLRIYMFTLLEMWLSHLEQRRFGGFFLLYFKIISKKPRNLRKSLKYGKV